MKTKSILIMLLCLGVILLAAPLLPPSSRAQSQPGQTVRVGQGVTGQVTVRVHPPMRSALRKTPPDLPEHEEEEVRPRMDPPADPSVRPEDIRPTSPETVVKILPKDKLEALGHRPDALQAPNTFTFFRNTPLAVAPVVGIPPVTLRGTIPIEPSGADDGRVVFYTTNNYAAVSGDAGQTFSYINPSDNFPADGANDPVNGGFNGDQVVYYERTRGLMFWLLQYNTDNNTNTQRLAFALSQSDVLNNNWSYIDLTPAIFGYTGGFWSDFPDLSVSDNFLYVTTNVFPLVLPNAANPCAGTCPGTPCPGPPTCPGGCTNACTSVGAVVARMPLDQFAQELVNITYYTDTHSSYRLTQGAHATMYWASHNSNTQLRIYSWPENGNVSMFDVNHSAFNLPTPCTSPNVPPGCGFVAISSGDGTNFAAKADSRIQGAWVASGVIGFMWDAPQGVNFPYPHVQVLRFNQSDGHLLSQGQVFSSTTAFLYASVHPNDRGHLGGTMAWGGGSSYPNVLAWIADDFNNGTITPLENVTFAAGNAGPSYGRWGDYLTTRVNVPYGNTWSGTGFVVNGAGGANPDPRYVWFGRERDAPPPTNTIYVDRTNTSTYEDGSSVHPYKTVAKGNFACSAGDTLVIRAGNYNETGRFNRAATVRNEGGIVRIGIP